MTGIDTVGLNPTVDMSANVYQKTHYLQTHDDRLAGRRIAYIMCVRSSCSSSSTSAVLGRCLAHGSLYVCASPFACLPLLCRRYLVPKEWGKGDGGALDLFDVDKNGEPHRVAKSLVPVSQSWLLLWLSSLALLLGSSMSMRSPVAVAGAGMELVHVL